MASPTFYTAFTVRCVPADPADPDVMLHFAAPRGDQERAVQREGFVMPPDFSGDAPNPLCFAVDATYISVATTINDRWVWRVPRDGSDPWSLDLGTWGAPRGAYPLGPNDILVFGTLRWGRITNGVPGWSVAAPSWGTYGWVAGAAQKGTDLHLLLYIRTGNGAVPVMSQSYLNLANLPATLPAPTFIPCNIPGESPPPVAMVAGLVASPDVAVANDSDSTADGFTIYNMFVAESLEVSGTTRVFNTRGQAPGSPDAALIELQAGESGGVVTSSTASITPYTPDISALPVVLPPGYTSYAAVWVATDTIGWVAPQPVPPFWTDKVNTRETLG